MGASNLKELKGCWIESCREMKSIFHEDEIEEVEKLGGLEVLWVSNSVNLRCIYPGKWQRNTCQNLKLVYLDCCPNLSTFFSSSQLPINLQVLQIKFCDELEAVFEEASPELEFTSLLSLHRHELPKLKSIGSALPSLQTVQISGCPNLADWRKCQIG